MEEKDSEATETNDNETNQKEQIDYVNIEDESLEFEDDSEGIVSRGLIEKRGCLKGCLLPIFIVFVLIIALGIGIHAKRNLIGEWLTIRIISNTEELALANLPKDMDRKAIEGIFEKTKNAFKEGMIDQPLMNQAIKDFINDIKNNTSDEKKKEEITRLIKALDEAIYKPN